MEFDQQLYKYLIDNSNDAIFVINPENSSFIEVNQTACRSLGYTRQELLNMGVLDIEANISDQSSLDNFIIKVLRKKSTIFEGLHKRKDGTTFHSEVSINSKELANKKYIIAIARNITKRRKLEYNLAGKTELLKKRLNELTFLNEISKIIEKSKKSLPKIYQEIIDKVIYVWQYPEKTCVRLSVDSEEFKTAMFFESQYEFDASIVVNSEVIGSIKIYFEEENYQSYIGMISKEKRLFLDIIAIRIGKIIERVRAEESLLKLNKELQSLAIFDGLTNIMRGKWFLELVDNNILRNKRTQQKMALLFLDLEKFKQVNDIYGHNIGDIILIETTGRIKKNIRKSDFIGRIGGDEFVLCLNDINSADDAIKVARKINKSFSKKIKVDDKLVELGVSIGISIYPDDGCNAADLLKSSDIAMYRAKKMKSNSFQLYS